MILLNPGPVTLSARVRGALAGPDMCHREPEFATLQGEIRARLLGVYALAPEDWSAVLLTGSGTAAVEAMLATLVPPGARLLVIENGVYGERMSRMSAAHGIDVRRLSFGWGEPVDASTLARALEEDAAIRQVAVVHHETTTGRLNDLGAIGDVCRACDVGLLVDAVSSFGAEAVGPERDAVTAVAATANKCLHGAPGACFVIARRRALAAEHASRTLYLDLRVYAEEQDRGGTPFTQAVPAFYALAEALREFAGEGGWQARRRRYREFAGAVAAGLEAARVRPLLPEAASSCVLRAWHLPPGLDYAALHDGLKARGFIIYAGQGTFAQRVFRISTMGAIARADIDRFLSAFREVLEEHQPPGNV
ncbi:MAG: 2-aminoethylphosphonate aminotransferase [Gammaproteobacteria bacterium]|nr:2-aminoethylphosphonate aminotransferase [Gammaproteobacteria bacterium]NIR83043.1 2-aminoethylphosphonate aminotransferase [Gammaproteobacteria bacterium]NIR90705.1 2-aminoethylphosphonate aminotransferase [Gammaproteobacteria bacterium]NIU04196.1 2-aminoethylphosphonate aminotransferase [Gammaproteobacteria bacterium]NIV51488.1 2-aminoethylphosphonate aminotransferase [Gammaproteobacteria bacterium]